MVKSKKDTTHFIAAADLTNFYSFEPAEIKPEII